MDLQVKIKRSKVVWRQIADQIRKKILGKELPPGTKLPSTAQLAIQIGTDVPTLHRALTDLVREGLITRATKIGTYVADWETKLARLGVYHTRNIHGSPEYAFFQAMENELHNIASQMNISVQVWTDPRPGYKQDTALPSLKDAASERVIQGVVSTSNDRLHMKWLPTLPVPVITLGNSPYAPIDFDIENFFAVATEALKKQGCRTVGVVVPFPSSSSFFTPFVPACEKAGLVTRPQWIQASKAFVHGVDYQTYGYQNFRALWRQKEKPDGLIVYPDVIATGVIMGILSENVRVPQDLKVVMHKNHEVTQFCPFAATFATCRLSSAARALIHQLDTVLKGREPKGVLIKHEAQKNPAL